jgi:hypothetical protein
MSTLKAISTLGKANQANLRKYFNFKTINQAIKTLAKDLYNKDLSKIKKFSQRDKDAAYKVLQEQYNAIVETEQDLKQIKEKQEKIKIKKEKKEKKKDETKTFMLELKLQIIYDLYPDKVYIKDVREGPFTKRMSEIPELIQSYISYDGYKTTKVIESKGEYLQTEKLKKDRVPKIKQMMKRSFVLENDWLKYAKSIADYAYDETNDTCVYHQLSKYLLNPPSGNPTKFINGKRMSEDAICQFLQEYTNDNVEYPNFQMNSGVSTELVALLCKELKRNLYAYDEDDKCFYNVLTNNENRNYCPIVYYKFNGHMYLLNSSEVIRSVAESNKSTAKKVITQSIDEENNETYTEQTLEINHIGIFDIETAMNMKKGIYLIQKSNITDETLKFISYFRKVPRTKNRDNVIVQMSYINRENEIVTIACDVNYGQNIDYAMLKHIANENSIYYVNEGIGSVILKVIEKSKKQERRILTDEEKSNLIKEHKKCCAICSAKAEEFEIDHVVPLSAGGSNDIENLQPLCKDCHKQKTREEKELGMYHIDDESASYFNKNVYDNVVNTREFKVWQFVERVTDLEVKDAYKIDMKKCRRNLAYYSNFEFPVYSVMDCPCEFKGAIKCGMYYVNTSNTFPFRGCGWYYEPLVKYGLDNGLISIQEIILEFIPSKKLSNDYFQNNIDALLSAFQSEPLLQKICVNAYIGLMGRTTRTSSKSKFTLCPHEASEWWGCYNDFADQYEKNVFIRNHTLDNKEILYEGIESQDIISETSTYPIYAQILQMEAIELHKLEMLIIQNDGTILDRNTDAVRYIAKKELDISHYYWNEDKSILKYQVENAKPLEVERMSSVCRGNTLDTQKFLLNWKIQYDYEGTAENTAKQILDSNTSYHIDGRAGTGKSFLTNRVIDELKKQNKKYLAFSPTNKGARIIGGKTIHSVYHKFKHNKYKLINVLKNIDYIIIDEISMMVEIFYQLFIMIRKIYPSIKFIIAGDFGQLPPVKDNWDGDYKNSPAMFELCCGNRLQLTKCRRSDDKLFELCKNVSSMIVDDFIQTEPTYVNIAYTHNTRIRVNYQCMERYIKETKKPYVTLNKIHANPKTQDLKLCVGMPVVAHTTNKKLNLLNSERFTISIIDSESVTLKEGEREIKIQLKDFHKFFYIGFCITIHTSQGETFTEKYTIYDWYFSGFCERAKYVALSRATDISDIQIA